MDRGTCAVVSLKFDPAQWGGELQGGCDLYAAPVVRAVLVWPPAGRAFRHSMAHPPVLLPFACRPDGASTLLQAGALLRGGASRCRCTRVQSCQEAQVLPCQVGHQTARQGCDCSGLTAQAYFVSCHLSPYLAGPQSVACTSRFVPLQKRQAEAARIRDK